MEHRDPHKDELMQTEPIDISSLPKGEPGSWTNEDTPADSRADEKTRGLGG